MEIFLACIAVTSAWFIYRLNLIDEKVKILNSINSVLAYSKEWFGTPYSEGSNDAGWYFPLKFVYKVDVSIINDVINSNTISQKLSRKLAVFIQLVNRFNYLIDVHNSHIFSDTKIFIRAVKFYQDNKLNKMKDYNDIKNKIEELKEGNIDDKEIYNFFSSIYFFQKMIHTKGIGDLGYYSKDIPKLHLCINQIEDIVKYENGNKKHIFADKKYILFDFIFIFIPLSVIAYNIGYYVLCFTSRFYNCIK